MSFTTFIQELWAQPVSPLHANMVLFGGFIILFGLMSLFVKERLYLTESLVATLVGILFGPMAFGVVRPQEWFPDEMLFSFLRETARLVIAMQVMAVGASLSSSYLRKSYGSLLMLLGPVMTAMWAVGALCVRYGLDLPWLHSLIIAACITPTDPVLAHSVIKGKFAERYIPTRMRNLLAAESGANDGLGLPFVMLPIYLLICRSMGEALHEWFLHTWFWELCVSTLFGAACGYLAHILMKTSIRLKLIDKESFLVFTIALAIFVSGMVTMMASDDLFAVFVAGYFFTWDEHFAEATDDSHFAEVIDMLFNITFFVFFGASIPWASFGKFVSWRLGLTAVAILLFRRLPAVMALRRWIPELQSKKEAMLAGWFGPMGVGAIFFSIQARDIILNQHTHHHVTVDRELVEMIFPVVCFIVLTSILVHGITVPLTNSHLKRRMKRKELLRKKAASELNHLADLDSNSPIYSGDEVDILGPVLGSPTSELVIDNEMLNEVTFRTVHNHPYSQSVKDFKEFKDLKDKDRCEPENSRDDDPEEYIYVTDDEGDCYEDEDDTDNDNEDREDYPGSPVFSETDLEMGSPHPPTVRKYRRHRVQHHGTVRDESVMAEVPDD